MYKYCRHVNLQMHCLICNIIRLAFQCEHPKSPKTAEFARVRRNVESVFSDAQTEMLEIRNMKVKLDESDQCSANRLGPNTSKEQSYS